MITAQTPKKFNREVPADLKHYVGHWRSEKSALAYTCDEGFLLIHKTDFDPEGDSDFRVLVDLIYVDESSRRKGVATRLLSKIESPCVAIIRDEASGSFFESQGFERSPNYREPDYMVMIRGNTGSTPKDLTAKLKFEAEKLYNACDKSPSLYPPTAWLQNQQQMRAVWEAWMVKLEESPPKIRDSHTSGAIFKYQSFMYFSFPSGFGKKLFKK